MIFHFGNRGGRSIAIALTILFLFVGHVNGQGETCDAIVKVVDAETKKEIFDAYAEAYVTGVSQKYFSRPSGASHIFENLSPGNHHFTVQKRGYKVSKYFIDLNCATAGEGRPVEIVVPLSEGLISEQKNVTPASTPKEAGGKGKGDSGVRYTRFSGPLSDKDIARLFNYLNYDAEKLGTATYPPAAQAVKASGLVLIHVIVNEAGEVESAEAVSGHLLLRGAAKKAAERSKFKPTLVGEKPIKIQGLLFISLEANS